MATRNTAPERTTYVPGTCNIGPAELRLRRLAGWLGVVLTGGLWAGLALADAAPAWRLLVAAPALLAAVGFLQAAFHFCVAFGLAGLSNFGPQAGKTDTVAQAAFRRLDRKKALRITGLSVLTAAATGAAAYLVR